MIRKYEYKYSRYATVAKEIKEKDEESMSWLKERILYGAPGYKASKETSN